MYAIFPLNNEINKIRNVITVYNIRNIITLCFNANKFNIFFRVNQVFMKK